MASVASTWGAADGTFVLGFLIVGLVLVNFQSFSTTQQRFVPVAESVVQDCHFRAELSDLDVA